MARARDGAATETRTGRHTGESGAGRGSWGQVGCKLEKPDAPAQKRLKELRGSAYVTSVFAAGAAVRAVRACEKDAAPLGRSDSSDAYECTGVSVRSLDSDAERSSGAVPKVALPERRSELCGSAYT